MNIDHPYILDILVITYMFLNKVKESISFGFRAILEFMAIVKPISLQNLHYKLKFRIPHTDLNYFIKLYVNSFWQIFRNFWDTSRLYSIQNKVNKPRIFNLNNRDDVVISRICIGHSRLTHS